MQYVYDSDFIGRDEDRLHVEQGDDYTYFHFYNNLFYHFYVHSISPCLPNNTCPHTHSIQCGTHSIMEYIMLDCIDF